jgi:hypothetical protein
MNEKDHAKAILGLELHKGRAPETKKRVSLHGAKLGRPFGSPMSQKQLAALRRNRPPVGKCLNPFGQRGFKSQSQYTGKTLNGRVREIMIDPDKRPERPMVHNRATMMKKRLRLKREKERALEAHELQQLARENATLAMNTLIEISGNKRAPEATRIAASQVILDRGFGKATQTSISASVTNGKTNELDGDELQRRIDTALKRTEELIRRGSKKAPSQKGSSDLRKLN